MHISHYYFAPGMGAKYYDEYVVFVYPLT